MSPPPPHTHRLSCTGQLPFHTFLMSLHRNYKGNSIYLQSYFYFYVREDVKMHYCLLQAKCCSIQEQCIAFPIYVG